MNPNGYIEQLEQMILHLIVVTQELEKENLELKKKLTFYEGPHAPPSRAVLKKKKPVEKTGKKRGAPKGRRGATRKTPKPEKFVRVTKTYCPRCGHELGDPTDTETKVIEDLPEPPKIIPIEYELNKYECPNCGLEVETRHEDCPLVGNFGVYLLVYITMLKFHLRGPLRKVEEFMAHYNDFEISTKGLMDMLLRVGDACKNEYEKTAKRIRSANWCHIDETGMHVNGEKWWLWIFRSNKNDVLTVIRRSRGRKVVDEILGKEPRIPVIVDGWKAYAHVKIIQRCWSHLTREVDGFKEASKNGEQLHDDIHTMYKKLKSFLEKNPPMSERKHQKKVFDQEIEDLTKKYEKFEELGKIVGYIKGGLGKWFTCILYPGMEPTNNLGEQAMREHVIIRKIIGCFRSENGSQNYQYIASLLATWKLQGKNMFTELEKTVRKELCQA